MDIAVVLPAPFGPTRPNRCPWGIWRLKLSTATLGPNRLNRPSVIRAGFMITTLGNRVVSVGCLRYEQDYHQLHPVPTSDRQGVNPYATSERELDAPRPATLTAVPGGIPSCPTSAFWPSRNAGADSVRTAPVAAVLLRGTTTWRGLPRRIETDSVTILPTSLVGSGGRRQEIECGGREMGGVARAQG